jgi:hypothetical protein
MAGERRTHRRLTHYAEAELEGLDVGRVPCRLAEVSEGGAFVEARTVLPSGAQTRLRFQLAGREIAARVEVRYSALGIGMGLRFVDLPDADREAIREFVG